ncbi:MAG: SPOR domain-containing protein [Gemmatimonadales bacterium]
MTAGRAGRRAGGRRPGRASGRWLGVLLLLALCPPARLPAQSDPRLVSALRLAQEGLSDSARVAVARLLAATDPADTLYAQVLYTRALVAADPREMRTDLQRVAVEYAASNWADDALLRLALLEYAAGQLDASARNLERIALDHSTSPLYARAAYWAGRVYFELRRPADACRWLREGREQPGQDVELRNQLEYYAPRCANVADGRTGGPAVVPDTTAAPRPDTTAATRKDTAVAKRPDSARVADSLPAPPPAHRPAFRIQIAAVNTAAAADSIAARARAGGVDTVVVVREVPYYKVRVGSYATRTEAAAALPGVRARFRGAPFVVADRE